MVVQISEFLNLALGGQWSTSHPGQCTPGRRASHTYCRWCWRDFSLGVHALDKIKIFFPCQQSNTNCFFIQPTA